VSGARVEETERPLLRVVRGQPTPAELAALVTVLAARAAARAEPAALVDGAGNPSAWVDRARSLRRPLPHGAGAWRASAWRS
jgi:hypothetical protein